MLSIGKPMKNVKAIVIDENQNVFHKVKKVNYVFRETRYPGLLE